MAESPTFDYIVVGAGTTGCVVAARLSAHGRVLLLEQGGDDKDAGVPEIVQNPERVFDAVLGDTVSKTYMTVPQAGLGNKGAKNRRMRIQQGHVVGGGSSINGMIYVRGNYRDFDLWAQLGNYGWSYKDVLPYFLGSERFDGPASKYHGIDGSLDVRSIAAPSIAACAFVDAVRAVFHESAPDWDFNGPRRGKRRRPLPGERHARGPTL